MTDRIIDAAIWILAFRPVCALLGHPQVRRSQRDAAVDRAMARRLRRSGSVLAVRGHCFCQRGAAWVHPD